MFSLSRPSLRRVAGMAGCGAAFVSLSGCYHRSSSVGDLTPAVRATVTTGQLVNNEQRLRRFPGINLVGTRNGGFLISVLSGLVGKGQPLYIIDDAPVFIEPSRGITWFKPEDIVQVRVLKNPAETSLYGPQGVNGVILITTRQGLGVRN